MIHCTTSQFVTRLQRAGRDATWRWLIVAPLALAASPCLAHTFLDGAVPRAGSEIAVAPSEVVLHFTEGVEPDFSKIQVNDQSGARVDEGAAHIKPNDASHFVVGLKKLNPGTYTVHWHVTSVDTHKTQGKFSFTVKP